MVLLQILCFIVEMHLATQSYFRSTPLKNNWKQKIKLNITGLKSQLAGGKTAGYLQARPRTGLDLLISSPAP